MKASAKSKAWFAFAIFLVATGLSVISAVYFEGISGEVFLVDQQGGVRPAPGAEVDIYRSDGLRKTTAGYLVNDASGNKTYRDRLLRLAQAEHEKRSEDKIVSALGLVQQAYCQQLSLGRFGYLGSPVETLNADRSGRFKTRLTPGAYVIFVEGQAGNRHAVWLEDVKLRWSKKVRLVEPQCDYSVD